MIVRNNNNNNGNNRVYRLQYTPRYDDPMERIRRAKNRSVVNDVTLIVPTNGDVSFITFPSQGMASNQRTGDTIELIEVEVNYTFELQSALVLDVARLIIFQTTGLAPTGVPPGVTDVLTSPNIYSSYTLGAQTSFKILHDSVCTLSASGNNPVVNKRLKLLPAIRDIRFVATTVQAYNGQCWLLYVTNANSTQLRYQTTLWYSTD